MQYIFGILETCWSTQFRFCWWYLKDQRIKFKSYMQSLKNFRFWKKCFDFFRKNHQILVKSSEILWLSLIIKKTEEITWSILTLTEKKLPIFTYFLFWSFYSILLFFWMSKLNCCTKNHDFTTLEVWSLGYFNNRIDFFSPLIYDTTSLELF